MRLLVAAGLTVLMSASVVRAEFAVVKVEGEVAVDDNFLKTEAKVADGSLIVSKDADAYIMLKSDTAEVVLKGEFRFELPEANGKEILARLLSGKVRVRLPKGKLKEHFRVRTPSAVVGVRGTDFFLSYWPLLNESEVICFESEVAFADAANKNPQIVKAGQWGGLGGRFGQKVAVPLQLSPAVLKHFEEKLEF